MERLKGELQRAKGQCELVKKLLADATAEKEIMYEVGPFIKTRSLAAHRIAP
jgi:hypothetical protein